MSSSHHEMLDLDSYRWSKRGAKRRYHAPYRAHSVFNGTRRGSCGRSACEARIGAKSLHCLNVAGAQGSLEALLDRP